MKTLIIDLVAENEIKVLHVKLGAAISVLAAYQLPVLAGIDPLDTLSARLREENLLGVPAVVIPPRQLVGDHTFHFPPMPEREIRKILPREIAAATEQKEEMVFDFRVGGRVLERQAEKVEVTCFFCDQARLFDYLTRLRSIGLRPIKLIPEAEALMALLQTTGDTFSAAGLMLTEVRENKIGIHLFRNRHWVLQREFAYKSGADETPDEDDLARVALEVNRTFQFFKQKQRGYAVEQGLIFGSSHDVAGIRQFLLDSLRIDCRPPGRALFKNKLTLPRSLLDEEAFVARFLVSLAAALASGQKRVANLLAAEFLEREKTGRRLVGLSVSGGLIAFVLIAATLYLQRIRTGYDKDLASLKATYQEMGQAVGQLEGIKAQRAVYFRQQLFLAYPRQYVYVLADFVRRLSLACTPGIELLELKIDPDPPVFRFRLDGRIRSLSNIDAQSAFIVLFGRIKAFDQVSQIASSGVKVSAASPPNPGPAAAGAAEKTPESELLFSIGGTVDVL